MAACAAIRGGVTTSLYYDYAGRKTRMVDPDMGEWTYEYDAMGNLTEQTDARLCVTTLSYDALNRLTGKTYSSCPTTASVSYGYDAGAYGKGQRTSMSYGVDSTSWTYDVRGLMVTESKTISGQTYLTQWGYNSADLPYSMTYPVDNEIVIYNYKPQLLLNSVIGTNAYVSSTIYDPASRMTARSLGNGLTQAYNYNPWTSQGGRLQSMTTGTLQNLAYQYDLVGNISQIQDAITSETQTFGYDDAFSLTSAAASGGLAPYNESYTYNATSGNLASKAGVTYTYDPNHPHAVASLSNGRSYQHDLNGNQVTRNIGSDSFILHYDAENRLVEVKKNGLTIATFAYDGDGRRVKSVIGSETILFVGEHYEVANGTATKYYFAGDQRVAMRKNGTLSYLLGDHLGSLSITTDANGNKISELKYKAWGEVRYSSGAAVTDYTFTGQYSNVDDFGLMYYGARWYDPGLSRCTQPDSVIPDYSNPLDWDRYNYTRNNPARYTDSSGHCIDGLTTIPCLLALIALAGGAGGAAYYEWNVTGHSWWESPEYASGTAQAAVEGALLAEGVGLAVGSAAAVAAPTLASGLCADGDCTNEVTAVAETSNNATSNTTSALVEYYPPNNGFQGAPNLQTLPPGSLMSRYGSTYGKFLSPAGTPAWARALPPGAENLPLNTYEVLKPLTVWAGPVASWFGEIGGGMQYYTGDTGPTIQTLIDLGYLIPR